MDPTVLRDDMVDSLEHPAKGVIHSEAVAEAMRTVPRMPFVTAEGAAHADRSHRVAGTTVFAPSTVARFLEALSPNRGDSTLVIGAGVGYTAAVLAELVGGRQVHAVDLSHQVVRLARQNLADAGYEEVLVAHGDGSAGLPEYGPYDRILVETAAIEPPRRLRDQLATDGRMVIPVGGRVQELLVLAPDEEIAKHGTIAVEPMLVPGEEAGAIERNRTAREDREYADRAAERRSGWEREWIDWDDPRQLG